MRKTNTLITSAVAIFIASAVAQATTPLPATGEGAELHATKAQRGVREIRLAQGETSPQGSDTSRGQVREFDIDAPKLSRALIQLTEQSGLQLIYPAGDKATDLPAKPLKGQYTTESALKQLLKGTGLSYEFLDAKTISIVDPSAKSLVKTSLRGADGALNTGFLRVAQNTGNTGEGTSNVGTEGAPNTGSTGPQEKNPDSRDNEKSESLEEIIVTAQKRAERLIDVPQSVSVLSADDLAKLGATEFRDFAGSVPGLNFITAGAGYTTVTLRGVTTGNDVSPTVGIYVDEVPYGSSTNYAIGAQLALDVGLFDMDRIEVLRGPQGTLYGASTMGGLLKYVTRRPDASRFATDVQLGVSETQHGGINYNLSSAVNLPLVSDKLALRISGFESRDAGYIDNTALSKADVNSSHLYGGRADVLFAPTDALSVRVVGFLQNIYRDGEPVSDHTVLGVPLFGELTQDRLLEERFDQQFRLVSATIDYEFGPATLTSVSSYQNSQSRLIWDRSKTLLPVFQALGPFNAIRQNFDLPLERFTQEVRLASKSGTPLEWVFGGYYTHESSKNVGSYTGVPAGFNIVTLSIPSRYEEYAVFGDLTWHFNEKLDVTGGIRYSPNKTTFSQTGTGVQPFARSAATTESDDEVATYLANARYHFSDDVTAYARYATGYRPGGPNVVTTTTDRPVYDSDQLKSYELGFRGYTPGQRFGIDAAVYHIDWSNVQVAFAQGGFGAYTNSVGGAAIKGAELNLTMHPISPFTSSVALAYQDATLSSDEPAPLNVRKGTRLPSVPRWTAAVNADYALPLGRWRPTVGASVRYVDERTNRLSGAVYRLPEYTTVDLRVGVTLDRVDLRLYVRNLLDERGELSSFQFRNPPAVAIQQPRTFGVSAAVHF